MRTDELLATSSSVIWQTNVRPLFFCKAPGSRWASVRTWKPLQIPSTGPRRRRNRYAPITGENGRWPRAVGSRRERSRRAGPPRQSPSGPGAVPHQLGLRTKAASNASTTSCSQLVPGNTTTPLAVHQATIPRAGPGPRLSGQGALAVMEMAVSSMTGLASRRDAQLLHHPAGGRAVGRLHLQAKSLAGPHPAHPGETERREVPFRWWRPGGRKSRAATALLPRRRKSPSAALPLSGPAGTGRRHRANRQSAARSAARTPLCTGAGRLHDFGRKGRGGGDLSHPLSSQSRNGCLSNDGGAPPGSPRATGQKRDESGVSTSSHMASRPSMKPSSNLVSAMMMPLSAARAAPAR